MKCIFKPIVLVACGLFIQQAAAQQIPTINDPGNAGATSNAFWSRSGNFNTNGQNNLFGTRWNSPVYFVTGNGINYRMKLNGNFGTVPAPQYLIDGFGTAQGVNTSGYLLLGPNNGNIYQNRGAFSQLHINGTNPLLGVPQDAGYRPWMKAGISITDNDDFSYLGSRAVDNDLTELTLTWGNNDGNAFPGPDDMVFRFTTTGNGNTAISPNRNNPNDIDGRHIARFTPEGRFGLGNTFGFASQGYVRPQSEFHMSEQGNNGIYAQITNTVVGETENDGMRWGVLPTQEGGFAYQENQPLRFFTDWNNAPGGIINGERLRITTVNAPGVPNPNPQLTANTTRVSISHDGANPVTQPRSLLHLGYNTGSIGNPASTDGWREWMDVGTFTAVNSDNMYVGMKQRPNGGGIIDGYDAIINWGDNQGNVPAGPDVLRFVFTSTTGGGAQTPASSVDGLELMQLDPDLASTLAAPNFGMVGIGDFSIGGPNAASPIDAKLDIDGDLRIREVTQDNSLTQFLVIDPTDLNRVHYADLTQMDDQQIQDLSFDCNTNELTLTIENGGTAVADFSCLTTPTITADNGLIINPANNVQWGQVPNVGVPNGGELIRDTEIPMEGFDVSFTGFGLPGQNLFSIGQPAITTGLNRSKFHVFNDHENISVDGYTDGATLPAGQLAAGTAGYIINANTEFAYGVYGLAEFGNFGSGFGVFGEAENNDQNYGVGGSAVDANSQFNWGGNFTATGAQVSARGIEATASSSTAEVVGVRSFAFAGSGNTNDAIGGFFDVFNNGSGNAYAGYFDGDVVITGTILPGPSDANMKTNVNNIHSPLDIINQLEPVSFEFDNSNYPSMNLADGLQYGLIAQDVETVLPELVMENTHPASYDSLGNVSVPATSYKGVEYTQFIPILIAGVKEQQQTIDSLETIVHTQDSINSDLQSQLNTLSNQVAMLNECLTNTGICNNTTAMQVNENGNQSDVSDVTYSEIELEDVQRIVLEQNVPNPFAEQTIIAYNIPTEFDKAQMLFYNYEGKLINTMDITEPGEGQIQVFANDLSSGIYTYTLVVDGQIVDSKKMVKTN